MTLDKPNLIKYDMNTSPSMTQSNSKSMSRYDQVLPESNKKHLEQPTSIALPQQQHQSRPERPRTLDTQKSTLGILKSSAIPFNTVPDLLSSNSTAHTPNTKLKSFSSSIGVGDDVSKPVKSIESNVKVETSTSPNPYAFDEQEEWAKISEIMANFGTDTSLMSSSTTATTTTTAPSSAFGGSTRRRPYSNRMDNGRSNSVTGYVSYNDANKSAHSVSSLASPHDIDSQRSTSPHGQLIDWLYSNELESLHRTLYDNGFDDVEFIRSVLCETDFDALVIPVEDRPKLLAAIENDLQTPARAVSKFMKTTPNKSSVYSSFNTNDKIHSGNNTANNNIYAQSTINNNYSTMPKQRSMNAGADTNATFTVDEWLISIKLEQYSEVFK